jgi:putative two-component system response regulator
MNEFNENIAVGQLSELLALERGYTPEKARQIKNAAVLHDIGKLKIPESILNKPGKLNDQEYEIIKKHTKYGAEMVSSIKGELGEITGIICLNHHEWHNGGGYWGIPAFHLPMYVPIVSISDVFTALIAKRSYKDAWPPDEALAYVQNQAGTQFLDELVDAFSYLILNDDRVPAIFRGD